jgi:putative Holliday junction resolvase
MPRILGIDYGERRIGLAISDPLGIIAQALPTLDTKKVKDVFEKIKKIVEEKDVEKIVLGFPRNMDGTTGERGEKVREFANELKEKSGKEIDFWDERLTSVASLRLLREEKKKIKREKKIVDQISAVLILQGYLNNLALK